MTLGAMPPSDAFWIDLPLSAADMSLTSLMDRLCPASDADADAVRAELDIRANPDLPDMYDVLRGLIDHWRAGTSRITFRTPAGVEANPSLPVSCWFVPWSAEAPSSAVDRSLNLSLEHRFDALAAYEIDGGDREGFMGWMRACMLIYFLDKHGFVLPVHASDDLYAALLQMAGPLQDRGFIEPSPGGHMLDISDEGRAFIAEMMDEAEAYIGAFDAFGDVVPPQGKRPIEFATGRGLDLRVQVFDVEGIDAYRAVFLLRLYDGSLDEFRSEWRKSVTDDEFLNWVIEPAVDFDAVEDDDLVEIIAAAENADTVGGDI
ncbi:MAG: hypothetical protein CL694_04205 [Chloroflexi bacterium]|nr:hypothetical protein [Chloroflexota bacterium]HAL48201.1 hypothetical protein [Dehalococcoidia bacterium]